MEEGQLYRLVVYFMLYGPTVEGVQKSVNDVTLAKQTVLYNTMEGQ
jgi:hypothetical protein